MRELSLRYSHRSLLLVLILISAVIIGVWQPVTPVQLLEWGVLIADHPLTIVVLILAQILLYAFALPGTLVLWLVAPFYAFPTAVAILLAGSVSGAVAAYYVAQRLGENWQPRRGAWLMLLLKQNSDIYTQCALRILPGCPHWVVNYTAGIVRAPMLSFLLAAVIGLTLKWMFYCWVFQGITDSAQTGGAISLYSLWPLLVLAAALVVGGMVRRRMILRSLPHAPSLEDDIFRE